MSETKYTDQHEWVRLEGDMATVGITAYAAEQLGDVVFVEFPDVGKEVVQFKEAAVIESVKAASEIYAPVSGEIAEVNSALEGAFELVNESPMEKGWIFKIKVSNPDELEKLMDGDAYNTMIAD